MTAGNRQQPARTPSSELGERLVRLAVFADQVPPHARDRIAARIDRLATELGRAVADTEE